MEALVIVDLQNDFVTGGALAVPGGEEIVPLVNNLQEHFDLVVATQDWHPKDHRSFASNHFNHKPFDVIAMDGMEQVLWPNHCIQGTKGAEFHVGLKLHKVEAIFRKGMDPDIDSYSAFFDNGHKKSTGLTGYLRAREVTRVVVCGLAGDYCVYYTAKDAIQDGFETTIVTDAVRSLDQAAFERAVKDILHLGGSVTATEELAQKI